MKISVSFFLVCFLMGCQHKGTQNISYKKKLTHFSDTSSFYIDYGTDAIELRDPNHYFLDSTLFSFNKIANGEMKFAILKLDTVSEKQFTFHSSFVHEPFTLFLDGYGSRVICANETSYINSIFKFEDFCGNGNIEIEGAYDCKIGPVNFVLINLLCFTRNSTHFNRASLIFDPFSFKFIGYPNGRVLYFTPFRISYTNGNILFSEIMDGGDKYYVGNYVLERKTNTLRQTDDTLLLLEPYQGLFKMVK